jgi:hypothetical protein
MLVVFLQQLTILSLLFLPLADISHTPQRAALAQGWSELNCANSSNFLPTN